MKDLLWNTNKLVFEKKKNTEYIVCSLYMNWLSYHRKLIGSHYWFSCNSSCLSTAAAGQGQREGRAILLPSSGSRGWLPLVLCQWGQPGEVINDPGALRGHSPQILAYPIYLAITGHHQRNPPFYPGQKSQSLLNPQATRGVPCVCPDKPAS